MRIAILSFVAAASACALVAFLGSTSASCNLPEDDPKFAGDGKPGTETTETSSDTTTDTDLSMTLSSSDPCTYTVTIKDVGSVVASHVLVIGKGVVPSSVHIEQAGGVSGPGIEITTIVSGGWNARLYLPDGETETDLDGVWTVALKFDDTPVSVLCEKQAPVTLRIVF